MSPTSETAGRDFRGEILIVDFVTDQSPFFGLTLVGPVQMLGNDAPVVVYFDYIERRPDEMAIRYLGGLLAARDYRLEQFVRRELQLAQSAAFPRPPRSLGRPAPVRQTLLRGSKLTCGGWR